MASYVPVVKNGANGAILYVNLVSQANTKIFQVNPTLAAGDVKISIDGAATANPGTLPTVTPAGSREVKITLSQAEVNGDNIKITFSDAAGAEWCDLGINIQTSARQIDDLAYPAISGRSMVVDASGLVSLSGTQTFNLTGNITGNLSGSVGSVTGLTASNLDVAISSRMATYTQPAGFLAATFPTGTIANTTNITAAAGCALSATGSVALTEGYRENGATGTLPQILYEILANLVEQNNSGTTRTAMKLDHATPAATYTYDSSTPNTITRAT